MDKKRHTIASGSRILMLFIVMIMGISMVSALEFDNRITDINEDRTEMTIYNSFLGIPTTEIGRLKLNTPMIYQVIRGEDRLVGEFTINLTTDEYKDFVKNTEVIDLKKKKEISREIVYKKKIISYETTDKYKDVCIDNFIELGNGTYNDKICSQVKDGTYERKIVSWEVFSPKDLKKGITTIGVFADVYANDYVDWIPTIFGVEIPWAVWSDSMSIGLVAYWNMNETSGTNAKDSVSGNANGTLILNQGWITNGKIGGATHTPNDDSWINITNYNYVPMNSRSFALSMWINKTGANGYKGYFHKGSTTGNGNKIDFFKRITTNKMVFSFTGAGINEFDSVNTIPQSVWSHWVFVYNATTRNATLYFNGAFDKSMIFAVNFTGTEYPMGIGYHLGGTEISEMDEVGIWNRTLTQAEITDLYNGGTGITYTPTITTNMVVTNSYPANNQQFIIRTVNFQCNATSIGQNITRIVLNVTNQVDFTQTITGLNTPSYNATFTNTTLVDGNYDWNCIGYGSKGVNGSSAIIRVKVDATKPYFTLNSLTNATTTSLPANITLDVTTTDTNRQACWFSADAGATNTTYICDAVFNVSYATGGLKTIYVYANDSFGNQNQTIYVGSVSYFNVTQSGSSTAGEGSSQTFTLLVNSTTYTIGDASANLWYNGVNKGVDTKTAIGSGAYYFTTTFTIPSGTGNATGKGISWYWNYNTTALTTRNTTTQTQTVYNVSITDCAVVGGRVILNMSLKDEELNSLVNITTPNTANIEIDLIISSLVNTSQTWQFSKKWTQNNSVAVCIPNGLLNSTNYKIDFVVGYDTSSHVREFFYMDNGSLDNTNYFNSYTDNTLDLLDLASADSTTFLFEYTDQDNQEVEDIIVHTFRKYIGEGVYREVERSKQDNAGQTHVHLVEEDVIYYFMITQYGNILFTSDTYNAKCLSTPCEISLSASSTQQNWSVIDNEGGQYSVSVNKATRVVTTTFSLDSIDLVNASVYRFYNGNASYVNGSSLTATSGSIDIYVPLVYDNSTFFVAIYNNNVFVKSVWISLTENARDYFGTFGAILGGLIVLAMMLMAVSEGAGFIIFTILALIIVSIMQLVDLGWMALISVICAGGIIVWKLVNRRGSRQ